MQVICPEVRIPSLPPSFFLVVRHRFSPFSDKPFGAAGGPCDTRHQGESLTPGQLSLQQKLGVQIFFRLYILYWT